MHDMRSDLSPFLDQDGRLLSLPARHKKKLLALWYLAERIDAGRQYTEPEINDLLDEWTVFRDHVTLRRELYNKRLLNRTEDLQPLLAGGNAPDVSGVCGKPCLRRSYRRNTAFASAANREQRREPAPIPSSCAVRMGRM